MSIGSTIVTQTIQKIVFGRQDLYLREGEFLEAWWTWTRETEYQPDDHPYHGIFDLLLDLCDPFFPEFLNSQNIVHKQIKIPYTTFSKVLFVRWDITYLIQICTKFNTWQWDDYKTGSIRCYENILWNEVHKYLYTQMHYWTSYRYQICKSRSRTISLAIIQYITTSKNCLFTTHMSSYET